ncbi:MAG: 30S ribosome-binding factor RbfA [Pirellulaceae bacterium]
MSSRRALKAAQAIREVVSTAILLELKDPRVSDVTVTMVEVSGDLRAAKVYVSIMGDETKQQLCLHGLRSSSGYLQKRVGNRIDTRYTPRLKFVLDKGAQNAMEVTRILQEVLPPDNDEDTDEELAAGEAAAVEGIEAMPESDRD